MRAGTLSGTSNSGTILNVGTPDFSTGHRSRSTTSTWNSRSQCELTANPLSGKLGADHQAGPGKRQASLRTSARKHLCLIRSNKQIGTRKGAREVNLFANQLVIGAGAIGTATAQLLADRGERVRLVTRSGGGPEHPAVERVAADASDADALSRLAEGAAVIYSCAGPAYHRWVTDWPPLAAALLRAAETSGALLVTTGNLYGYGAAGGPMTEGLPLRPNTEKGQVRVRIWNEALEAHRAGRIRTAEVRSSDYLGAGAVNAMTLLVLPRVLAGKRASAPADLDAPHSW